MNRYVDFDGTLAEDTGWKGFKHMGKPIPDMIRKVKKWLEDGDEVIVHTARLSWAPNSPYNPQDEQLDKEGVRFLIEDWCEKNIGKKLKVTNEKQGYGPFYDDWGCHVIKNTGMTFKEHLLAEINIDLKLASLDHETYTVSVLSNLITAVNKLEPTQWT